MQIKSVDLWEVEVPRFSGPYEHDCWQRGVVLRLPVLKGIGRLEKLTFETEEAALEFAEASVKSISDFQEPWRQADEGEFIDSFSNGGKVHHIPVEVNGFEDSTETNVIVTRSYRCRSAVYKEKVHTIKVDGQEYIRYDSVREEGPWEEKTAEYRTRVCKAAQIRGY